MKHTLPTLPYALDALAPRMSRETFDYHYGKHLQTYLDNVNRLIAGTAYETQPLDAIVCTSDGGLFNNAAQAWNHIFFFRGLTPDHPAIPERLAAMLRRDFGTVDRFREAFSEAAVGLFGSGWVWLTRDASGRLSIAAKPNAGTPLTDGVRPVLTLDVWEHAYYIDYRNRRADYVAAWWDLVDWRRAAEQAVPRRWRCKSCDYVYDPAKGDPETGIAAGTFFEDIPETWTCPVCGLYKTEFIPIAE